MNIVLGSFFKVFFSYFKFSNFFCNFVLVLLVLVSFVVRQYNVGFPRHACTLRFLTKP